MNKKMAIGIGSIVLIVLVGFLIIKVVSKETENEGRANQSLAQLEPNAMIERVSPPLTL